MYSYSKEIVLFSRFGKRKHTAKPQLQHTPLARYQGMAFQQGELGSSFTNTTPEALSWSQHMQRARDPATHAATLAIAFGEEAGLSSVLSKGDLGRICPVSFLCFRRGLMADPRFFL